MKVPERKEFEKMAVKIQSFYQLALQEISFHESIIKATRAKDFMRNKWHTGLGGE